MNIAVKIFALILFVIAAYMSLEALYYFAVNNYYLFKRRILLITVLIITGVIIYGN